MTAVSQAPSEMPPGLYFEKFGVPPEKVGDVLAVALVDPHAEPLLGEPPRQHPGVVASAMDRA